MIRKSMTVNGSHMFGHQPLLTMLALQWTRRSGTGISSGYLRSYLSKWLRTMLGAWPFLRLRQLNITFRRLSMIQLWVTRKLIIQIYGSGRSSHQLQFTYQGDLLILLTSQHIQINTSWLQVLVSLLNTLLALNNSSSMDNSAAGELLLWAYSLLSLTWSKPMASLAPPNQYQLLTYP